MRRHAAPLPGSGRAGLRRGSPDLARQERISARELVRRARAAAKLRAAQDREAMDRKRTKAAEKAAKKITSWLEEEHNLWPAQPLFREP